MAKAFHRAARRARIPLRYSEGFHPAPRVSFERALALGLESLCEKMKWELEEPVKEESFLEAMNRELPRGLRIRRVLHPMGDYNGEGRDQSKDHYLAAFREGKPEVLATRIQAFLERDRWLVHGHGGYEDCDIRPRIKTIALVHPSSIEHPIVDVWADFINQTVGLIEIVITRQDRRGIRVDRAIGSILSLPEEELKHIRILKLA
jgi:radical SAM-linked protein